MSRYRRRFERPSGWQFNMTPLIDVTFLLLTYFMLASHFASAEKPDMKLPQPDQSQAVDRPQLEKIIINVMQPDTGQDRPRLTFGPVDVASLEELGRRLGELARANPKTEVTLRADRRITYGEVRKVMETIAAANLGSLQIVAEQDEGS